MKMVRLIFISVCIIFVTGETSFAQYYGGYGQNNDDQRSESQSRSERNGPRDEEKDQSSLLTDGQPSPLNLDGPTLLGGANQPTLLLQTEPNIREGVIEMIIPQQNRLVIGDQSISLSRDVEINTEKRRKLYGVNNLKRGMTVRLNTDFSEGQLVASEITELNKPNKYKNRRNKKTKRVRKQENRSRNNNNGYGGY